MYTGGYYTVLYHLRTGQIRERGIPSDTEREMGYKGAPGAIATVEGCTVKVTISNSIDI